MVYWKASHLDERLCGIKPPNEIQPTSRRVSLTLKYWKGIVMERYNELSCEIQCMYK